MINNRKLILSLGLNRSKEFKFRTTLNEVIKYFKIGIYIKIGDVLKLI
jgi:hypothetical protein